MRRHTGLIATVCSRVPVLLLAILLQGGMPPARIQDDSPRGTGQWDAKALGNHRAVVRVENGTGAVRVHIPWFRRDVRPEEKAVLVVDGRTGQRISNVIRLQISGEAGDLVFEPVSGAGEYYVYYLPFETRGSKSYPQVTYLPAAETAAPEWLSRHHLMDRSFRGAWRKLPSAKLVQLQSIDGFNSFYPMDIAAPPGETAKMLGKHRRYSYLLFPEDRSNSIRMTDHLPLHWVRRGPGKEFAGRAARGEYFTFQIGLLAVKADIQDLTVTFTDLRGNGNALLPASSATCFNTGGIDWRSQEFRRVCPVPKGKVQALWCGIQIPPQVAPGLYEGMVTVAPAGLEEQTVRLRLTVAPELPAGGGDDDPARLTRLRWLNSALAADETLVPPFTPLKRQGRTIDCLGRSLTVNVLGLPESIQSFFKPEMTGLQEYGRELLAAPVRLLVETEGGQAESWQPGAFNITGESAGAVRWTASASGHQLDMAMQGVMEFDGFADFQVTLTARGDCTVGDIRLELPLRKNVARYLMGLGARGGLRPDTLGWKWDRAKNQDALWAGDINGGVQISWRDENYIRPLNTNFYNLKPLNLPPSWWNDGRGGVEALVSRVDTFLVKAYSGPRNIRAGERLHFNFSLLLTPFKCLDTRKQWQTRFFHSFKPLDEIADTGANTINVHHATAINPFINYPFFRPDEMKKYIDEAHARGMKVKIYYTVRELTNRAPELFMLRSLGDEVLAPGPGGGFAWLQEHLGDKYIAGWLVPELEDAAVINSGVSRWHNFYVEGLDWLVKHTGIDGLYIDDVAFDRNIMKRVRRVLDRNRSGALIDLHSANQYNPRDGFASSANLYLEHFPYLDRLWFGEYFDYNASPDYWLVEMSGIPFGLMGEMLEGGGNPWRGMVFGMTSRLPWAGDPRPIWKAWDDAGLADSQMIGHWVPDCPVRTGRPDVLATVYRKEHQAMVALASWSPEPVELPLEIDWNALGINPRRAQITAPAIPGFQESSSFGPYDMVPVQPGRGWLLLITERKDWKEE